MTEPFRILVVCRGNICRSPLAEWLLRQKLTDLLDLDADAVRVESAGVSAQPASPMDPLAAAQLVRLGGDPSGFRATRLTRSLGENAHLVLTATKRLRSQTLEEAPRALRRTFTIREFAIAVSSRQVLMPDEAPCGPNELVRHVAEARAGIDLPDLDVPDPIGGPESVHRRVADLLDLEISVIAAALARSVAHPGWTRERTLSPA